MLWCTNDFFASHSGFQRIAWYSGSAAGGGANRTYETNPLGERGFFVYRAVSSSGVTTSSAGPLRVPPFDLVFNASYNEATTTNPREWQSTFGFGYTMIMGWNANEKAWGGSAANNGTDTFTAGATAPFSASSIVFPRVNGTSGTDATKRNGAITLSAGTNETILAFSADNDTVFIAVASQLNSNYTFDQIIVAGGYERITGSYNVPLVLLQNPALATDAGSTTTRDGGGVATTSAAGVRVSRIEHLPVNVHGLAESTFGVQAAQYIVEYPLSIWQYEASNYRPCGFLNHIRVANRNVPNLVVFASGSSNRLVVKPTGTSYPAYTIPWSLSTFAPIKV